MPQAVLVQLDTTWEAPATNRERIAALLGETAIEPGALIVLPEMCTAGFTMDVRAAAESGNGENERFFAGLARRYESWLLAGLVRADEQGRGVNQAVAFNPSGDVVARYTKLFPFTYAGESDHYQRGDRLVTFDWQGLVVAPFICFDVRFPEVFRAAAMAGADVFPILANFPAPRHEHWRCLSRARAIENQAYVLAVNRAGSDPNVHYRGASCVIDPWGERLIEADESETVLTQAVDPARLEDCRARFPVRSEMRAAFIARPTIEWHPRR